MRTAQPQLLIIAGPNGAGKSSFSKAISAPDAVIYDPDVQLALVKARFPELPLASIYHSYQQIFMDMVYAAIKERQDFTMETNFRDHEWLGIVDQFKKEGYTTHLIYFALETVEESLARVAQRVANGGHFVDKASVQYNFETGLKNLEYFSGRFDILEVRTVAPGVQLSRSLLKVKHGKVEVLSNNLPASLSAVVKNIAVKFQPRQKRSVKKYRGPIS